MEMIRIQRTSVEQILPLRHRILRAGLPFEAARLEGDTAPSTIHLAALAGERVVGCVSLMPREYKGQPAWQVRGMAIDEQWQRRGIGRELLSQARSHLPSGQPIRMWCNARVSAVPFYQRQGWWIDSEPFEVPTAGPHVKMRLDLP